MAKWRGVIGYCKSVQVSPGVWKDEVTERTYTMDVIKNASRWSTNPDSTNDDLVINNHVSIVADPFAYQNCHTIKYVEFMGVKWKVTSVDASQRPRLTLMLGGVYNG